LGERGFVFFSPPRRGSEVRVDLSLLSPWGRGLEVRVDLALLSPLGRGSEVRGLLRICFSCPPGLVAHSSAVR